MSCLNLMVVCLIVASCSESGTDARAPGESGDAASREVSTPVSQEPEIPVLEGGPRLDPVDEAASDASFEAFRNRLREIVGRRDRQALLEVLDPQIHFSFGAEEATKNGFVRFWKLDEGDDRLWRELEAVLALGGAFDDRGGVHRFLAPYVYSSWPDESDPFENVAATCDDAVVRETPDAAGTPIVRLDHHIVKVGARDPVRNREPSPDWRQIELPDGREGYIEASCVRSNVDYRAGFEKKNGEWKMVFFVAGD